MVNCHLQTGLTRLGNGDRSLLVIGMHLSPQPPKQHLSPVGQSWSASHSSPHDPDRRARRANGDGGGQVPPRSPFVAEMLLLGCGRMDTRISLRLLIGPFSSDENPWDDDSMASESSNSCSSRSERQNIKGNVSAGICDFFY